MRVETNSVLPPRDETTWATRILATDGADKNVLSVLINAENELLVENERLAVSNLRERTKFFLLEEADSPTKAVVSIQNDRSTEYKTYLEVYNELRAAYNDIWEKESQQRYQTSFDRLGLATQQRIRRDFPLVISEAEPKDLAAQVE